MKIVLLGGMSKKSISWPEHLRRCAASGLSKKVYCERYGLSYQMFFYHQRRMSGEPAVFDQVMVPQTSDQEPAHLEYYFPDGSSVVIPASVFSQVLPFLRGLS